MSVSLPLTNVISLADRRQAQQRCSNCRHYSPPFKDEPGMCHGGIVEPASWSKGGPGDPDYWASEYPLPLPKPWPYTAPTFSCQWWQAEMTDED